ncbi:DUF535 family protein [Geomesophilobacter sediminis]|uniref:DUF535 family protein n=1 Tax=Geomesophilobacter sediminis TaxID=2798584 RepID=A0A8J7IP66_9BACT|nr:DUF535 family protein [Geomesophilobacter sediminis]MBJ6725268.1 DUF535 family protein [Geomesophilobacter sediminis]
MKLTHRLTRERHRIIKHGPARYITDRLRLLGRLIFDAAWGLVFKVIFANSRFRAICQLYPQEISKLKFNYLALSFNKGERLRIFLNHYYFLKHHFLPEFVARITEDEIVLWEHACEQSLYRICIELDAIIFEGELSLILKENDTPFYALAFAFVPSRIVALPGRQALYISRLQGARNALESVHSATKAFNGLRPQEVLLASARGVAQALQVSTLAGVRTVDQLAFCRQKLCHTCSFFNYDRFWEDVGGTAATPRVFSIPLTPQHPSDASTKHRTRKKIKYETETQMIQHVRQTFKKECLKNNDQ